ncbi:glycosyltransferase [Arthrobacter oryzae]|uniref:glycosyltransferase n=1 Tax=Arthrobacter oryzae TaxID=409290 RepID=UPI0030C989FC
MSSSDLAVIVVHHKSFDSLVQTLRRLLLEDVVPSQILIVDNGGESDLHSKLHRLVHAELNVIYCDNKGYGAAVNAGVEWHSQNTTSRFTLVSTHESLPEPGATGRLVSALINDAKAAVAGPALVTGHESDVIWSLGGYLSPIMNIPRHFAHGQDRSDAELVGIRPVKWIDGAFLVFRREVLEECPIDERFFLYMEEVDHQIELGRRGWRVLMVGSAVVWQSSAGTPSYYQARNIQLFQSKNGSRLQKLISTPFVVARTLAKTTIRDRTFSQYVPLFKGWRDGALIKSRRATSASAVQPTVIVVNPLGGALAHYTEALTELLRATGADVKRLEVNEPSISGSSRFRWVGEYLNMLRQARRAASGSKDSVVLLTWPVFGFLDLLIVKVLCGKDSAIVYHDPKPLVRSVGSGRITGWLMRFLPGKPRVIVHSQQAKAAMESVVTILDVIMHPMFRPPARRPDEKVDAALKVIRVLGQYKQDRDVDVLRSLAAALGHGFSLEIVGRGWPAVPGWLVDARFVPEEELALLARTSDVILIPYKRFYQSGIAVRAVECGTPVVGRARTSLADVFGESSRLLVGDESLVDANPMKPWTDAVRYAIEHGREETCIAGERMYDRAAREWKSWTITMMLDERGVRS